jgi:Fe2+ or Zn2+ uptake regulation protein
MVRVPVDSDDVVVQELRAVGLRVTMPRQAVLTWLARHPHSTADAIAAGVRDKAGALSLQAIYGNHHHLVCRRCGVFAQPVWRPGAPWPGTHYHEEEWQ